MKSRICQWESCQAWASVEIKNDKGRTWAHLCAQHAREFNTSVKTYVGEGGRKNLQKMLSSWVKAYGGAAKMRKIVLKDIGS